MIAKADEDGSPGTSTGQAVRICGPVSDTVVAWPLRSIPSDAPKAASMVSVWSRVICGSCTTVVPVAPSAARSTADLTWADAIGGV